MARRRFKRARASRFFARKSARRAASGNSNKLIQIDAMVYGALRPYVSGLIAPLTNKIPLGNLADEAGMGLLNYFVAKRGGMFGSIARKGLIIENGMIGSSLSGMFLSGTSTASNGGSLWTGGY